MLKKVNNLSFFFGLHLIFIKLVINFEKYFVWQLTLISYSPTCQDIPYTNNMSIELYVFWGFFQLQSANCAWPCAGSICLKVLPFIKVYKPSDAVPRWYDFTHPAMFSVYICNLNTWNMHCRQKLRKQSTKFQQNLTAKSFDNREVLSR